MKRSFRMIFIMLIVLTCLVALSACNDKALSLVEETNLGETPSEESSAQETSASTEEEAADEPSEEAPASDESIRNQDGETSSDGEDAATQTIEDGNNLQTGEEGSAEEGALEGQNTTDDAGEDAPEEETPSQEDYLSYLYRTDRKQYYEYRAEQREIEILPLSFFDLTGKGEHGYPIIEASAVAGDYALSARGESVASLHVGADGKAILSKGGVSSEAALWGDYDREYEIITECEGEVFGVSSVGASKAKVMYFLVTGQGAYGVVFRKELNAAQIDAEAETILALLAESPQRPTLEETPDASEEPPASQDETLTDEEESKETLQASDPQDAEQREPPAEPATDRATERRTALAPISGSGCYVLFEEIGGVAEISGEVIVTEEREDYSLRFLEMSEEEFAAALDLFDGMTLLFSAGNYRSYQAPFDGKVFIFTLLLSEEEGSISLRAEYAA